MSRQVSPPLAGGSEVYPATRRDLEEIAVLAGRSRDWISYADKRRRDGDAWLLIARTNGQLTGLVHLQRVWIGDAGVGNLLKRIGGKVLGRGIQQADSILHPHQFGYIRDLVVVDDAHYCEAGSVLVTHCIQQMQHSNIEHLQIELSARDEAMQKLCHNLGFQIDRYHLARAVPVEAVEAESGIRPADQNDLPQLAGLVNQEIATQVHYACSLRLKENISWEAYVIEKLKSPDNKIFVYDENDRLKGYVELRSTAINQRSIGGSLRALTGSQNKAENGTGMKGFIEDIFVEETWRRQGVAIRMLKQVDHACHQLGIRSIYASVWANNQASLGLFRKAGWQGGRIQLRKQVQGT